ncbi:kunitz-like toxin PcKuz2 [Antechinus flavipes]|uniref:kunitz-like toxin PcKuz2 n=1 Tax=Antechinus flavipes TaxID=38775 RepID=UPI0022368157|nr:kunitz-like toxin PcKuz2 [Antechinus flavipes]XP_051838869.1 kunitz-like toxin PcKuz2 [Antechinus flavipes]
MRSWALLTLLMLLFTLCPELKATTGLCKMQEDQGFCRGYFLRWFFNKDTKKCETFIYGGCGGNRNNFYSKIQCIGKCIFWAQSSHPYA